ncbi:MAG: hypothetical protein Q9P90_06870 [candidate division KSB1 bacterium]|nr:hypothetical protein [candidate division KSB1 bacterium]
MTISLNGMLPYRVIGCFRRTWIPLNAERRFGCLGEAAHESSCPALSTMKMISCAKFKGDGPEVNLFFPRRA